MKEQAKRLIGPRATVRLRSLMRGYERPRWGNLRRTAPFSATYGFERGTPIDRYYLHAFLAQQQHLITGDVLEVQTDAYTQRFGRGVHRADTFDIVPSPDVTYVCDFSHCERSIPNRAYDCLLLPNTLPHFRELEPALSNAIRVVRPGGAILASAAGLLPLTGDVPEYWRLSPDGWRERLVCRVARRDARDLGTWQLPHRRRRAARTGTRGAHAGGARRPRPAISGADDDCLPRATMTYASLTDTAKAGLLATRWYAHRLEYDTFPGVLVLCYHGLRSSSRSSEGIPFANLHVTEDTFAAHCRLIAETCHPIDLAAFTDAQLTERALPPRPVLVTFDDGYRSVFDIGRPILRRYRIPASVFVCSEPVMATASLLVRRGCARHWRGSRGRHSRTAGRGAARRARRV